MPQQTPALPSNPAPQRAIRRAPVTSLSLVVDGGEPPSAFRIFSAGEVTTSKGVFTFDAAAAKSVLADYAAQGNELMVDYDHASLSSDVAPDPAQAGKAAGWFDLEMRGGELWAVNVRWTEPAAAALQRKEWRYMSPAFSTDDEGRILSLLNVALTNIPATRRLDPLMAASRHSASTINFYGDTSVESVRAALIRALESPNHVVAASAAGGENTMDGKLIAEALDALIAGDSEKCAELLKGIIAAAAGADPDAQTEDAPPPVGDGGADESSEPAAASAAPVPPPDDKKKAPAAMMAAARMACAMTGKSDIGEAMAELARNRAVATDLETREARLRADQATLELSERRRLVGDLVKLGAEIPATAWSDDKGTVPADEYQAMPIQRLRDKVAKRRAASAPAAIASLSAAPRPPVVAVTGAHGLTEREIAICKETGCEPETFAALKAHRDAVKTTGGN